MVINVVLHLENVYIKVKLYNINIMKIFLLIFLFLAIAYYIWVNLLEGLSFNGSILEGLNLDNSFNNLSVTPGITTIDRFSDPKCKTNEYIYCIDGLIECNDIFGDNINIAPSLASYESGNTFTSCGSYIDKINLKDYVQDLTGANYSRGVYFDLSQCNGDKPWRVGGQYKVGFKDKIEYKTDISFQGCFSSELEASNKWDSVTQSINKNQNTIYKNNDKIFVEGNYLLTNFSISGLPAMLKVFDDDKDKFKFLNNKKYYKAIIIGTGTLYTIRISNNSQNIDIPNANNNFFIRDSLYNKDANDYYTDLKPGSHPRPTCKNGVFTSCLKEPPYTIDTINKIYIPTNDPLVRVNPNSALPDTGIPGPLNTPFTLNPSGFSEDTILESNYYETNQLNSNPFVKCIADFGSNIGDPLCCKQKGILKNTKYICPQENPKCLGYSKDDNLYGYCS